MSSEAFLRAATSSDQPDASLASARDAIRLASDAGDLLMEAYTGQVFQSRLSTTSRLPTHLGCVLDGDPQGVPTALDWTRTFNAAQAGVSWRQVAPSEGQYRWDLLDSQMAWCRRNRLAIEESPGPLRSSSASSLRQAAPGGSGRRCRDHQQPDGRLRAAGAGPRPFTKEGAALLVVTCRAAARCSASPRRTRCRITTRPPGGHQMTCFKVTIGAVDRPSRPSGRLPTPAALEPLHVRSTCSA